MTDYKRNDPKGWCGDPSRGAALGRPSIKDAPRDFQGTLNVKQIPLDGDYDENGTYWGAGEPLFWVSDEDVILVDFVIRAKSFEAAREYIVGAYYPLARIERLHWDQWEKIDANVKEERFQTFFNAYVEAALWSSTISRDENDEHYDEPFDEHYSESDLAPGARDAMEADCRKFFDAHTREILTAELRNSSYANAAHAGHDFWLTRNGHGCGFWDGDWPEELGKKLTEAAHVYSEVNLYLGDDELIHCA